MKIFYHKEEQKQDDDENTLSAKSKRPCRTNSRKKLPGSALQIQIQNMTNKIQNTNAIEIQIHKIEI